MNTYTWIMILIVATSSYDQSGAAGVTVEFNSQSACELAGKSLTEDAVKRGNYVLTWGCFKK